LNEFSWKTSLRDIAGILRRKVVPAGTHGANPEFKSEVNRAVGVEH